MAILSNLVRELEEENDRLTAELAEARDLARRAAQMLIEEIGAPGPENVDETATRAVATITRLTAENAALRELLEEIYAITSYGDALASMRFWCKQDGNLYDIDVTRKKIRAAIDAGEEE
jgi:vacuolar-type H+-ATPase subunit I/STV1